LESKERELEVAKGWEEFCDEMFKHRELTPLEKQQVETAALNERLTQEMPFILK
jgi:hypothetical protein